MPDDAELQQKIARLRDRISRHKHEKEQQQQAQTEAAHSNAYAHAPPRWAPSRGTPYGTPRGRGYGYRAGPHMHRTLIVKNTTPNQSSRSDATGTGETASASSSSPGWVVKRDRHMQLINNNVYDRKVQQRTQAMAETRKLRDQKREERQKARLASHLSAVAALQQQTTSTGAVSAPHVTINEVKFIVSDGGSKLIRSKDDCNTGKPTPKRANVGGVTFMRSKHGNLYRSGLVKTMRYRQQSRDVLHTRNTANFCASTRVGAAKSTQLCPTFCSTGTCPKGPACGFTHDANKTAICREFLAGKCTAGEFCDLSHDPTPERVPSCLHFMRGNCTNAECKYPHVRVNPGAPVCRAFAVLGYCSKGLRCTERHVHECPDYSNKGTCRNKRCRLPHVDRAGQLRKAAAQAEGDLPDDDDSSGDISSDDELDGSDSDDVDSDCLEEVIVMGDQGQQLAHQQDFVKF